MLCCRRGRGRAVGLHGPLGLRLPAWHDCEGDSSSEPLRARCWHGGMAWQASSPEARGHNLDQGQRHSQEDFLLSQAQPSPSKH